MPKLLDDLIYIWILWCNLCFIVRYLNNVQYLICVLRVFKSVLKFELCFMGFSSMFQVFAILSHGGLNWFLGAKAPLGLLDVKVNVKVTAKNFWDSKEILCKYASTHVAGMRVCSYASMQVIKYASMQVNKKSSM